MDAERGLHLRSGSAARLGSEGRSRSAQRACGLYSAPFGPIWVLVKDVAVKERDDAWLNHPILAPVRRDAVAAVTAVLGESVAVVDTEFQRKRIAEIAVSRMMRASGGCVMVGGAPRRRPSAGCSSRFTPRSESTPRRCAS